VLTGLYATRKQDSRLSCCMLLLIRVMPHACQITHADSGVSSPLLDAAGPIDLLRMKGIQRYLHVTACQYIDVLRVVPRVLAHYHGSTPRSGLPQPPAARVVRNSPLQSLSSPSHFTYALETLPGVRLVGHHQHHERHGPIALQRSARLHLCVTPFCLPHVRDVRVKATFAKIICLHELQIETGHDKVSARISKS